MTRAFWAELVLGAVFAVLALMFLGGSFAQNKDAQASLTDYSSQTNESIRAEVVDSGTVTGSGVVDTVTTYTTVTGNTKVIYVVIGTEKYGFRDSTTSMPSLSVPTSLAATAIADLVNSTDKFEKETVGNTITFTKQ